MINYDVYMFRNLGSL